MMPCRNQGCRRIALSVLLAVSIGGASLGADEPFDYFQNSWNVIGLKDYNDGTRVTPDNRLLLADGREVGIRFGRSLAPLSRKHVKTLLDGWMPIIRITAVDGPVRYEMKFWATPLPSAHDWQKAFDWPTEGDNFLNWITARDRKSVV